MLIVTSASDFTRDSETSPGGVTKKCITTTNVNVSHWEVHVTRIVNLR